MQSNRTPTTPDARHADEAALSLAPAQLVVNAKRLPEESDARAAIVAAMLPLDGALDDLTGARRITFERASSLLDAATAAVLTQEDGTLAPALAAHLAALGVASLGQLHEDEAADVEAFIAAR